MFHSSNYQGRTLFSSCTPITDAVNKFKEKASLYWTTTIKMCLKTASINPEPESCLLYWAICNIFLVISFLISLLLSCLNMCTSNSLLMILFMWRDPLLFWNLISYPFTCQDSIYQMNCYIKSQYLCRLRHLMIYALGQMTSLVTFSMK